MTGIDDAPIGRRERKKQQTRASLESAALQLFAEKGFAETTVEDITEAADVSPRTFFRYFDSKEAVLFPEDDDLARSFGTALSNRPPGEDVLAGIRAAVRVLAEEQVGNREQTLTRARISLDAPEVQAHAAQAAREWEQILSAWLTARLPDDAPPMLAELLAGSCVVALRVALGRWIATGGTQDPETMIDEALDLVQHSPGGRAGLGH